MFIMNENSDPGWMLVYMFEIAAFAAVVVEPL